MHRWDIINHIVEKNNYNNYLEIGVRWPNDTFNKINISHKDAVDPEPKGHEINYPVSSDEFFELIKDHDDIKYDIIFIDGLHLYEQVKKDIENSLKHLSPKGTIIMHDCSPPTVHHAREMYEDYSTPAGSAWNGTVWEAYVENRCANPNITMSVVNTDYGMGVIQFGKQDIWKKDDLKTCQKYSYLEKNRKELLNLLEIEEFAQAYKTGFYNG